MTKIKFKNGLIWMKNKLHKTMFLEDISNYIRFSIYEGKSNREVLKVSDELEKYFRYNDWFYIEYDLIDEIANMIIEILEKGKSFLKIIYYEQDKKINGIEIRYIPHIKYIKFFNRIYIIQRYNYKYKIEKYYSKDCILLNASNIGIHKIKTKNILRKFAKYDCMKLFELSEKGLLPNGLEQESEREMIDLFKISKEFYWDARDSWSKYLNSPYILYREVNRHIKLIDILEKTIDCINNEIKNKIKICEGQIVANIKNKEILKEMLEKILNGIGTYDELSNYLFNKK